MSEQPKSFPALARLIAWQAYDNSTLPTIEQARAELKAAEELLAAARKLDNASLALADWDRLHEAIVACERKT